MISKEEIHENDIENDEASLQRYQENEYEKAMSGKVVRTWVR
jgi:hypothetical protein